MRVLFAQHKECRVREFNKLADVIPPCYRRHLIKKNKKKSGIVFVKGVKKYTHANRIFRVGIINGLTPIIILAKPAMHAKFPEQICAHADHDKIVSHHKPSDVERFSVFHQLWSEDLHKSNIA